eukprot:scaffold281584_cov34-Prasinocladus_malaysianus.AAC.2
MAVIPVAGAVAGLAVRSLSGQHLASTVWLSGALLLTLGIGQLEVVGQVRRAPLACMKNPIASVGVSFTLAPHHLMLLAVQKGDFGAKNMVCIGKRDDRAASDNPIRREDAGSMSRALLSRES